MKGQQVIEQSFFPLESQLPDGKDVHRTEQRCYQLKIQSPCKYYLKYTCCPCHHLYHECNILQCCNFDIGISYTPIFLSKSVCTCLLILDFNRLCEIEVQSVEKSNVWTDVAVRTSSWQSDDSKVVEFLRIHMLLTPLRLVLVL